MAVAQLEVEPGDRRRNLALGVDLIREAARDGARLVVLPELFATGYYMFDRFQQLAEPLQGATAGVLSEASRRTGAYVVAGIPERGDGGSLYDTAVLVTPGGGVMAYRKAHLWDREALYFTPGRGPPLVDAGPPLGRVGLLVCYDLEFPETAGRAALLGARMVAAPAAFGNPALWRATLTKRARQLGLPIAAANRLGLEGDTSFHGNSMVVSARGEVLVDAGSSGGVALAEVELADPETVGGGGEPPPPAEGRLIHPEVG